MLCYFVYIIVSSFVYVSIYLFIYLYEDISLILHFASKSGGYMSHKIYSVKNLESKKNKVGAFMIFPGFNCVECGIFFRIRVNSGVIWVNLSSLKSSIILTKRVENRHI